MTFSLIARCAQTGQFGMVIASSSPAVAARCAHARAGVGVVASQNITDPALGPALLDLMERGMSADDALLTVANSHPHIAFRQLLIVDAQGRGGVLSGAHSLGIWKTERAENVAAGGNLLANNGIPAAMLAAYAAAAGSFGDRLMAALHGGLAAGGEAGPVHSAGMKIVDRLSWPIVDLRCDWTDDCPITALQAAWDVYRPQMDAYVQRAEDPTVAPSYGVPGDE
ncbi:DUF1028 domain-containing protein [Fertoebacter nigrum]|uniref:DUF1028 domain-containing protein n=1 Tax=Fertoeibacter niger TaxID=2656921 RepID=A0A8X8H8Y4_9RHOB|nr:DUF1028 domain-containing protein [Fertoeibacter niger]NUB45766.1 DUF1028 domain-containing protein [Fertoeibacter niger]